MGTPARIIALTSKGLWGITYVNYDGYQSGVGQMLFYHYHYQAKIDMMLEHGHMSQLAESPLCPEGHSYDTPVEGHSIYYGRDRNEDDTATDYFPTMGEAYEEAKNLPGSYCYIWDGIQWYDDKLGITLEESLIRDRKES